MEVCRLKSEFCERAELDLSRDSMLAKQDAQIFRTSRIESSMVLIGR